MRKPLLVACVLAVLAAGYLVATPYITVHRIKAAAKSDDGSALSEHIDFVALRQNLKDQLNVVIAKEMAQEVDKGNEFAALGGLFMGVMIDKLVDAYVTPAALTELMKGNDPKHPDSNSAGESPENDEPFSHATMGYESSKKFVVKTVSNDGGDVAFVLRRHGIDWKLTEIVLPLEEFE